MKYFCLAAAIQMSLLILCAVVASALGLLDAVLGQFLMFYLPFIRLIERWGDYHGESAMIKPLWFGVPLGILVYSILAGILGLTIRGPRSRRRHSINLYLLWH